MAKYTSNNYNTIYVSNFNSFSLSYTELVSNIYGESIYHIPGKNMPNRELTEEEAEENAVIDSVKSFNVVVYTSVYSRTGGMSVKYEIDNHLYDKMNVNNLNMLEDFEESGRSSIALYNTNSLNFESVEEETEGQEQSSGNKEQKYLWLLVKVEIPSGEYKEVFLKIVEQQVKEDENKEDNKIDEEHNDFIITDDDMFDGEYGEGTDYESHYIIKVSEPIYEKYVFLNSVSVYELNHNPMFYDKEWRAQVLHTKDNCIRLKVDPSCMKSFTIYVNSRAEKTVRGKRVVSSKQVQFDYVPSILELYGNAYPRAQKMNLPNVSYALLRTNPKLTGNVKVVVDSNGNLYLDTFKVSTTLSERRYRHVKVDADTYYGQDLMMIYGSVPSKDFYKVEDKCYPLFTTAQTYNNQYYDLYFSGVKTNDDKMYSENFSILAPLCVKDVVPDFFLIFKVDKNVSGYSEDKMTDKEKINFFLKNGKLIKSFDMRQDSILGKYIRNISYHAAKEVGDLFVSYEDTNYDKFIGISLDRGVVSSIYETPFKREYVNNQVALNDFYTRGFERNHLVSKNIVNLEFMFNDTSSELFSIDTYYGLYVKVNTQENNFSCIGKISTNDIDNDSKEIEEIATYEYDDTVYSFPSKTILSKVKEYEGLIYGVTTPKEFIRLDVPLQDSSINENFLLKPYRNIFSTTARKVKTDDCVGFLTVKFNRILEVGDHIRIIDKNNLTIYEILLSNVSSEYNDIHDTSDVICNYYTDYGDKWTIYRVSTHIPFRRDVEEIVSEDENPTMEMFLSKQVEQIFYALRKFNAPKIFTSWKYNTNSLSIVSYVKDIEFERICSPSGFTNVQREYLLTYEGENDTLEFFGSVYPTKTLLIVDNELINTLSTSYLYPYNFKLVGNRIGYCIKFLDLQTLGDDYAYYGKLDSSTAFETKSILYKVKDNNSIKSILYESFDVEYTKNLSADTKITTEKKTLKYVTSYEDLDCYFFNIHSPFLQADTLLLYDVYPINSGVCSIFNVKDFDFDVLDSNSVLSTRADDSAIGTSGEYVEYSIFNYEAEDKDYEEEEEEEISGETLYDLSDTIEFNGSLNDIIYNKEFLRLDDPSDPDSSTSIAMMVYTNTRYLKYPVVAYNNKLSAIFESNYSLRPFIAGTAVYNQGDEYFNAVVRYIDYKELCRKNNLQGYRVYNHTYEDMLNDRTTSFENNALYVIRPVQGADAPDIIDDEYEKYDHYVYVNTLKNDPTEKFVYLGPCVGTFEVIGGVRPERESFVKPSEVVKHPIRKSTEENIKDYIDKYRLVDSSLEDEYSLDGPSDYKKNYYEALINSNHTRFDISLISPYSCKWKSIGTDARGENLRIMYDYIDSSGNSILQDGAKSYFCVGTEGDLYNKYLGYLQYINKNIDSEIYKKYIVKSPNMHTYEYDEEGEKKTEYFGIPYKNCILNGYGRLDDLLYDSKDNTNKFSVAYLSGENTIEFISCGVKFRIKSSNDNAINLNKYKGYNVVFVSIPDINIKYSKQTELLIDETTKEIMFIWYQPVNTFRFGATMFNSATDIAQTGNFYTCRINFNSNLTDIACTYIESTPYAKVPDDNNFMDVQEYDASTNENIRWLYKKTDTPTGKQLCKRLGFIYLDAIKVDPDTYTKYNNIVFTGRLYDYRPISKYINEKHSYYLSSKHIYTEYPILWHNNYHDFATITDMNRYCYDYPESINAYLYTDNAKYIVNNIGSYNDLKSAISSCGIYIKSYEGTKDYTKLKNILSISVVDPIKFYKYKDLHYNKYGKEEQELGYVHSTYAEPVMKDMFKFGYTTYIEPNKDDNPAEMIDDIFKKSFEGANIVLNDVDTINQIWLNKYTEEPDFCIKTFKNEDEDGNITYNYDANLSIDVRKNVSIMSTCWNKEMYRNYYTTETGNENYNSLAGYVTGYEMKTFVNSRGINLNGSDGKSIEITSWKNTEISDEEQYIKLDITDSIIYHILFRDSYIKSWRYLKLTNNTYKINYIKNTILPFININNKTKFILYKGKQLLKSLHFQNDYNGTGEEIKNYKNELKFENGKYYMYVYPEDYTTYSAKMIINL